MNEQLKKIGYLKLNTKINSYWIEKVNNVLPSIFDDHQKTRTENGNEIYSNGLALNALVGNQVLFDFLQYLIDEDVIDWLNNNYFKSTCILNSFSALSNLPRENKIFHRKVHRDIRGFSGDIPIMLNMLVMLDDFTEENGATLILPESHLYDEKPDDDYFSSNCIAVTGKKGDIVIWNSNLYHTSGHNKTIFQRRALPITFSLPYYKQLLDYPRAIGYEKQLSFNKELRNLLGYNSRVPASLSEWYSSPEKRLYKN